MNTNHRENVKNGTNNEYLNKRFVTISPRLLVFVSLIALMMLPTICSHGVCSRVNLIESYFIANDLMTQLCNG